MVTQSWLLIKCVVMKRGYSDRLAELEVRLMDQERRTGSGFDAAGFARERRKMFVAVKDPRRAWTRRYW